MKKYLILLLAALLTLSYCKKPQEINNPGDNTESRDPSAGPQDPSGSPSDYTPPTIPEDQVSDDPDFDVPDDEAGGYGNGRQVGLLQPGSDLT